jgi:hypothetical protein
MCGKFGNILVVIPRKFIGMWIALKKEIAVNFFLSGQGKYPIISLLNTISGICNRNFLDWMR